MKKLATLLILFLFFSCAKVEPIEKYKGKGIVLVSDPRYYSFRRDAELRVKTKDSIFYINTTAFDAKNLKQGDTIK
jgi:hypothetical protein